MVRVLLPIIGMALLPGCSVVGIRGGLEQPAYRVIDQAGPAEIREYGPRLAAETTVTAADVQAGRGTAFRTLANYIFGGNKAKQSVAMTAPVEVGRPQKIAMTAPVQTAARPGEVTMAFFLPARFTLETAPQPNDPNVHLRRVPPETLAVLQFTGWPSATSINAEGKKLVQALAGTPWHPTGEPYALLYDPPWTIPFLRRNEVAVGVTNY